MPLPRVLPRRLPRAKVYEHGGAWRTYVRLEDPPGLSPITTLPEQFAMAEEAKAADERRLMLDDEPYRHQ